MITLLTKIFIKNHKDYGDNKVREAYGKLSGIVGIVLNLLLFAGKFTAGIISGALSITADAFNNLTDAGSSIVTFIGFKISSKPIDRDHPFGHGRMEYVAGFIVSMLIFLVGFELIKSSVEKLITPTAVEFSYLAIAVLGASVLVKFYMYLYNNSIAKKINSVSVRATAKDSLSDCIATTVVGICFFVNKFTGFNIDAIAGLLVALFILYTGFNSAKETINLLLGTAPDEKYVSEIENTVLSLKGITGIHDLIVHNYGPGRQIISLHAEVDANANVNEAHDDIDNAEVVLEQKFGCIAVIHMDPIDMNNPRRKEFLTLTQEVIKSIDSRFSIHDFRMTEGTTHINLIFDLTIPHDCELSADAIKSLIVEGVRLKNEKLNVVCKIEYCYSGRV